MRSSDRPDTRCSTSIRYRPWRRAFSARYLIKSLIARVKLIIEAFRGFRVVEEAWTTDSKKRISRVGKGAPLRRAHRPELAVRDAEMFRWARQRAVHSHDALALPTLRAGSPSDPI